MSKFNYCHSLDELKWNINPESNYVVYLLNSRLEQEKDIRFRIKEWILENCKEQVYCWNVCSTPTKGEFNYEFKLSPSGDSILYFSTYDDFDNFINEWNSIIDYVGSGYASAYYVRIGTYTGTRAMTSSKSYISIPEMNDKIIWAADNCPKSYPLCKIRYYMATDTIYVDVGIVFDLIGHQAQFICTFTELYDEWGNEKF